MLHVVLLMVAAQTTPAHPVRNPDLARAIEQVAALDEQGALESLAAARAAPDLTPAELATVHLYEGLAHAGLANGPEAVSAFHAARLLDPSLTLPADASPRVREWWAQASPTPSETRVAVAPAALPAPQPPEVRPVVPPWVPWAAAGAAVVAAGAGVWSGVQASGHAREANQPGGIEAATALRRRAEGEALRANVLYGSALVLGGGAALLFVMRF